MSALRVVSLSIIAATVAAAASVALASETAPVSRAEVRRQVLQARADRELARPGEAMQSLPIVATSGSTLSRRVVRDETLVARRVARA